MNRLVLFAHGSRDPRWRASLQSWMTEVSRRIGNCTSAYMELTGPSLMDVAQEAAAEGVTHLRVLPLFMSAGGHVMKDIPRQAAEIEAALPGLTVDILPAVGEDPRFGALVEQIGRDALG